MSDEPENIRRSAEVSARRVAAAISGAIEGFLSAVDEFDPAAEADKSFQAAGGVARAAGSEAKAQADTPEMRQVGEAVADATAATTQAAERAVDRARESAQHAKDDVKQAAHDVRQRVDAMKEGVVVRAEAVAESGRRARAAPRRVGHELREGMKAWWRGLVTALAMWLVLGVLGIVTLVVLTIALVVGLNALVGDPAGTWLVVGLYVLIMLGAYGVARSARSRAAAETRRRVEASREELRHVAEPMKNAFRRGPPRAGS